MTEFLMGAAFLTGAVCGFVLAVGMFVARHIRITEREIDDRKRRIASGARR